jgi:hypothetical protein
MDLMIYNDKRLKEKRSKSTSSCTLSSPAAHISELEHQKHYTREDFELRQATPRHLDLGNSPATTTLGTRSDS